MKSLVVRHSIIVDGRKTSINLEDPFGSHLKDIAHSRQATLSGLVADVRPGAGARQSILEELARETADANSSAVSRLALYERTYRVLCDAGIDERLANELARERVLAAAADPFSDRSPHVVA
jgi:predicted DNA-binding ribbon-helix-helix protein